MCYPCMTFPEYGQCNLLFSVFLDGTLLGATALSKMCFRSNSKEGALDTPQIFRTETSPSDAVYYHIMTLFFGRVLHFYRGYCHYILSTNDRSSNISENSLTKNYFLSKSGK